MKINLTNEEKLELENIVLKQQILQLQFANLKQQLDAALKHIAQKYNYTLEDILEYNLEQNYIEFKEINNVHSKN